ncbi:MAG: nitroreductase family protein [Duncaniella sp.]|nr:nitroreductase family protein [Muribaculum sp.]MCM1254990.1 nitroreductase family protein [Duncaniella sp.]
MQSNAYPQLYELARDRFSCRSYSDQTVERDSLLAVMDVVRLAPSACNRQPWMFLIADSDELRNAIFESYDREWIRTAPEFIVACGVHSEAWHRQHDGKDHTDVDVSIAVEHLCLAATAMELATCWVCNFDAEIISKAFNLPDDIEPIAIIPIGYPAEGLEIPEKKRKSFNEIIKWGKF